MIQSLGNLKLYQERHVTKFPLLVNFFQISSLPQIIHQKYNFSHMCLSRFLHSGHTLNMLKRRPTIAHPISFFFPCPQLMSKEWGKGLIQLSIRAILRVVRMLNFLRDACGFQFRAAFLNSFLKMIVCSVWSN